MRGYMHVYNSTVRQYAYRVKEFSEQEKAVIMADNYLKEGENEEI